MSPEDLEKLDKEVSAQGEKVAEAKAVRVPHAKPLPMRGSLHSLSRPLTSYM